LTGRRPTLSDAPGIVELVNACTRADVGMTVYGLADVGARWAARADDLWVVADGDDAIVGYLETEQEGNDLFFEGFVDPRRRGRGIGSHLAASAEAKAANARTRTITTNVGSDDAVHFFERRRYAIVAREYAMFMNFNGPPQTRVPEGVAIRTFVQGADEAAMYEVIRDAFGDDWPDAANDPAEWMRGHQAAASYDPNLWLFAAVGGDVVGAAMNRSQWHAQADTGWVKNLGVRPRYRGRGIGRALLFESARRFYERGKRRMVLGVSADNPTGAPDFYRRVGLLVGGRSWDLRRPAPDPPAHP
jgi:mycothiol synthase